MKNESRLKELVDLAKANGYADEEMQNLILDGATKILASWAEHPGMPLVNAENLMFLARNVHHVRLNTEMGDPEAAPRVEVVEKPKPQGWYCAKCGSFEIVDNLCGACGGNVLHHTEVPGGSMATKVRKGHA